VDVEVCQGLALNPPTDTAEMRLTVLAEAGKRVAVEVYNGGVLSFFGVDESVDVVAGQNSSVQIVATSYTTPTMWRDTPQVAESAGFNLIWNSTPGAWLYHFQESPLSDFSVISFETTTPDTIVPGPLSAGDYYFRVRNVYTPNAWSNTNMTHVYGPPVITSIVPNNDEYIRGDEVTVTINGNDLNYLPGMVVTLFGRTCTIDPQSTESQLIATVTAGARAFSDVVRIRNNIGQSASSELVLIQTIAYIMGDLTSGDLQSAQDYKAAIDAIGADVWYGTVAIVPYALIDFIPMSAFEVIIVGWDSGTDMSNWGGGVSSRVAAIANSGSSVMGIGIGGAAFFEAAGIDLGLKDSEWTVQDEMYVLNGASQIFTQPHDLKRTDGSMIAVYADDGTPAGLLSLNHDFFNPPPGVSFFSTRAPTEFRFPFAEQDLNSGTRGVNFLWGFHASPRSLSADGAMLSENVVVYLFREATSDLVLPTNVAGAR
jgi:hypothetical protein